MDATGGTALNGQLDLMWGADGRWRRRTSSWLVPTSALARDRRCHLVLRKVRYVRGFFGELDDISLRVGLTRRAAGLATLEGNTLWLNPSRLALHTIAHELTHLLQGRALVPQGERSCDLFALARDPSLADIMPYYLKLPRGLEDRSGWLRAGAGRLLCELAREAVALRVRGHRRYIAWFEKEVGARWANAGPARETSRVGDALRVDSRLGRLEL